MKNKYYSFQSGINRFSIADKEINFQHVPFDDEFNYKLTNKSNPFSDCGSWFGYYFSDKKELMFTGPMVISQEIPVNIAKTLSNIKIKINNKFVNNFKDYSIKEENGVWTIKTNLIDKNYQLTIIKKLIFSSSEDALFELKITGKANSVLNIELINELDIYKKVKYCSSNGTNNESDWVNYFNCYEIDKNKINLFFDPLIDKNEKETLTITHNQKVEVLLQNVTQENETLTYKFFEKSFDKGKIEIKTNWYQSFYFNKKKNKLNFDEKFIESKFEETEKRWKNYFESFKKNQYKDLAYKAIYTLIGNWLAPNGKIKSHTVIPSITYSDFIGAYAWDIFKISYGVVEFFPFLAQEAINSMFDHQITKNDKLRPWDEGMIPDCIFYNYSKDRGGAGFNWNERNTKPPLASWSVLKVYEKTKDDKWLKQIYPKLKKFQLWWLRNRRSQSSEFFLSYGATLDYRNDFNNKKSVLEAISWESGMDNAPRFDWDRIEIFPNYVEQKAISYVCDQNSVCLNAFYYLELNSLLKIEKYLKQKVDYKKTEIAKELKLNINKYMYSDVDGFYHDIKFNKKKPLTEYGLSIEQFLPLYAKIASVKNAKNMIKKLNSDNFLTPFPFPTVAKDNQRFDPTDYWRGPVWISFAYFALFGIKNYNLNLFKKINKNILNILSSKEHYLKPLRENYHPLNKKGLSTTNFSWTSSLLLVMIKNY